MDKDVAHGNPERRRRPRGASAMNAAATADAPASRFKRFPLTSATNMSGIFGKFGKFDNHQTPAAGDQRALEAGVTSNIATKTLSEIPRPRFHGHCDFIVCGAGSSGSVVAGRLAANPDAKVLLIEAGGSDQVPEVTTPAQWPMRLRIADSSIMPEITSGNTMTPCVVIGERAAEMVGVAHEF